LIPKLARKHGVDKKSRTFTPWSHVVSQIHAQLAHSLSLNDVCDDLRNHSGVLSALRGATPPSRNGLSHANRERNADMAEELFWTTLSQHARFDRGGNYPAGMQAQSRNAKLKDTFTAADFDARTIACVARDASMKYIALTTPTAPPARSPTLHPRLRVRHP